MSSSNALVPQCVWISWIVISKPLTWSVWKILISWRKNLVASWIMSITDALGKDIPKGIRRDIRRHSRGNNKLYYLYQTLIHASLNRQIHLYIHPEIHTDELQPEIHLDIWPHPHPDIQPPHISHIRALQRRAGRSLGQIQVPNHYPLHRTMVWSRLPDHTTKLEVMLILLPDRSLLMHRLLLLTHNRLLTHRIQRRKLNRRM